jgi:predicted amino acid-binding ACT domain protein
LQSILFARHSNETKPYLNSLHFTSFFKEDGFIMSQLFKTNLEEYARQCTLQRRRYEECLQQAQQSCIVNTADTLARTTTQNTAGQSVEMAQVDACVDQTVQSCMIELLEMPIEALDWDDENSALDDTRSVFAEERKWHGDRVQVSHQTFVNPTAKSPSPVGFGAP